MDNLLNNKTLILAVEKWGKDSQVDMSVEEMSELIKALLKERRNDGGADKSARLGHIAEEMADVFIMLNQLIIIFNNKNKVQECIEYKIRRLEKLINH